MTIADKVILFVAWVMLGGLVSLNAFLFGGILWSCLTGGPEVRAKWAEARRAVAAGWHPKRGKD